jgi:4-carboxymuconolactone decarboxylase
LALQEGTSAETIEGLRIGLRPSTMSAEESLVYDFVVELTTHRGVSDATYAACIERIGERGVIDLVGMIGYFTMMSMVLNVAHTPPNEVPGVAPLPALPL